MKLTEKYKNFISDCKTEREVVSYVDREINDWISESGASVMIVPKMGKAIGVFSVKESFDKGFNILCAHIDSPRLDVKQKPIITDGKMTFLNTHYYGGIKKYQWVTLPLAIHGVVCKKDGTTVNVCIGEKEEDPVFCISDLLPHLSQELDEKSAKEFITGEELDVIISQAPSDKKGKGKEHILKLLKSEYGIEEDDFESAELEVVPAGRARDLGLDRGMILGYGHDDRSCAFASLQAFLDASQKSKKNCLLLLVDKEEIGSVGATGLDSCLLENMLAEVMNIMKGPYSDYELRKCLENSRMLSSDVNAAFDPHHPDVFDKDNSSYLGEGAAFNKFTGSRGKSGSNDANPEFIARLRAKVLEGRKYQMCELGKVDKGGGGTIAYLAARYGMEVIDMGIPVLSMHAPWEVINKLDLLEAYEIYKNFLVEMD